MKKRTLFILGITYFWFFGNCFAQGPGFMGKHFYARYDLGFTADTDTNGGSFSNYFSFNYVFHKRLSVGISHNRYGISVRDYSASELDFIGLPVRELGFNVKAYLSSQFIAPMGTYFIAEVSNINVDLSEIVEYEFGAIGISFGFGISRVLYNKLILDVSSTFGVVTNKDFIPDELINVHSGLEDVDMELTDFNFLTWRVGIGYLLF